MLESPSSFEEVTTVERPTTLEQHLDYLREHLEEQPKSVQEFFATHAETITHLIEASGRVYLTTDAFDGNEVFALVEKTPGNYASRGFRFSRSDNQWKALPGYRDNSGHFMKGEEKNELHHYVQSAKIDKELYQQLDALPSVFPAFLLQDYLPIAASDERMDEFTFTEKYGAPNNDAWRAYQYDAIITHKAYTELMLGLRSLALGKVFVDKQDRLYKFFATYSQVIPEFTQIVSEMDSILGSNDFVKISAQKDPEQNEFTKQMFGHIGDALTSRFTKEMPSSMMPNFQESKPSDTYTKSPNNPESAIEIEEYTVTNEENDLLTFAMAKDSEGRYYVDNIYNPRVPISSYGTYSIITQMGHLINKPEDYSEQTIFIPEEYKSESKTNPRYVDISKLLETLPIVREYAKYKVGQNASE